MKGLRNSSLFLSERENSTSLSMKMTVQITAAGVYALMVIS